MALKPHRLNPISEVKSKQMRIGALGIFQLTESMWASIHMFQKPMYLILALDVSDFEYSPLFQSTKEHGTAKHRRHL